MNERLYQTWVWIAVLLTLAWVGWTVYDSYFAPRAPGDFAYLAGQRYFADGEYASALQEYNKALRESPAHIYALRGKANTLLMLEHYSDALYIFNQAIAKTPDFAGTYANRGILYDRMGQPAAALQDYDTALAMDAQLAQGPNWLTRFLRLQPEKPPTILERAEYLRAELAKPEAERLLTLPAIDAAQRPYKQ